MTRREATLRVRDLTTRDLVSLGPELEPPEAWEEGTEAPAAFFIDWWLEAGAQAVERLRETRRAEWDLLAEHTVAEAMNRTVCSVPPDEPLGVAARYMVRAGIHRLLVLDDGRPVGILTSMDIVRALADGRLRPAQHRPGARSLVQRSRAARTR